MQLSMTEANGVAELIMYERRPFNAKNSMQCSMGTPRPPEGRGLASMVLVMAFVAGSHLLPVFHGQSTHLLVFGSWKMEGHSM